MIISGFVIGMAGLWMLTQNSQTKFGAPLTMAGVVLILIGVFAG